jgi:hypothetical protein
MTATILLKLPTQVGPIVGVIGQTGIVKFYLSEGNQKKNKQTNKKKEREKTSKPCPSIHD